MNPTPGERPGEATGLEPTPEATLEPTPEVTKACCAAAYDGDAAAMLLGTSQHPGGAELTRRLADRLALRPGQRVLDVASGRGTTALLLAAEYGVRVDGVDLGEGSVASATAAAGERGLADRVRFRSGDAERLPFEAGSFDAVVCECALCTFPDKPAAATEFARVLEPGGRLGITDVTVDPDRLHHRVRELAGWVACLGDARPLAEYVRLLAAAGLPVAHTESHDEELARMVERATARLRLARMVERTAPALEGMELDGALEVAGLADEAVRNGVAGYALLVAGKAST